MGRELVTLLFFFLGMTFTLVLTYFIWTYMGTLFSEIGVDAIYLNTGQALLIRLGRIVSFAFFALGLLSLVLASRIDASPLYYVLGVIGILFALFFVPAAKLALTTLTNNSILNDSYSVFTTIQAVWGNMGMILFAFGIIGLALTYRHGGLGRVAGA